MLADTGIKAVASLLLGVAIFGTSVNASIFSKQGASLTFYYDIGEQSGCGSSQDDPVPAGWAQAINSGPTYCEQQRGYSLSQIGTNAIVAFDQDKVWADPATWCGRGVKLWKPDGTEYVSPDGPLYIWDSCLACAGGGAILDVSAPTFVDIKGGTCGGNNPTGVTYEVLDTYVVEPSVGLQGPGAGGGASSAPPSVSVPPAVSTDFGVSTSLAIGTGISSGSGGASTSAAGPVDGGYSASSAVQPPYSSSANVPSLPPAVVPISTAVPASQAPVNTATLVPAVNPTTQTQVPAVSSATQAATTQAGGNGGWSGWGGKHNWGQGDDGAVAAFAEEGVDTNATASASGVPSQCRRQKRRRLSRNH
ncbi:hypothetical protein IAU59_006885 [Kwoniella sp. CBS 9459]